MYFRHLEGGLVEITATYPAGKIGTTAENLLAAAEGENEEWTDLYPAFADMAESEGLKDGADVVPPDRQGRGAGTRRATASCSTTSRRTSCSRRPEPVKWICRKCGFVHEGPKALKICPACEHPQAYQEIYAENF